MATTARAATTNGTLTSTHATGTSNGTVPPKITLYTNHRCPFAHRAHIVLAELDLPFEEVIIDLDTPRPQWYLDINPRGKSPIHPFHLIENKANLPSIKYQIPGLMDSPAIITESAIVAQFLADAFPSPLLPSSHEDPLAPLRRARIGFFTDTWNAKLSSFQMSAMKAPASEKQGVVDDWVAAIEKEIEPLLADAGPFFGGSKELTLAEAIVAPFLVRMYAFADDVYIPKSLGEKLDGLPNFGKWSQAVMGKESVMGIWEGEKFKQAFAKKYGGSIVTMK
ncbi:uncharacterized protein LTR77_000907 [Saxophila tyrrhenica]|uniref:GST N-terminal domain-containing protein n=1 Tax=Saxophila tyrrhenica TaxID=1690608 RepID=A0AAV9PSG7_9PEZI|nr:hypothetical protein LTR77_000907 [Saxophila tyrrhenica]